MNCKRCCSIERGIWCEKINIVKKITVSAGLLAAVMLLVTGVTYASLKTRTKAVDNVFKGACVNIGIVEKIKIRK